MIKRTQYTTRSHSTSISSLRPPTHVSLFFYDFILCVYAMIWYLSAADLLKKRTTKAKELIEHHIKWITHLHLSACEVADDVSLIKVKSLFSSALILFCFFMGGLWLVKWCLVCLLFFFFFFILQFMRKDGIFLWNFVGFFFVKDRVQYGLIVVKTFSGEHVDDKWDNVECGVQQNLFIVIFNCYELRMVNLAFTAALSGFIHLWAYSKKLHL